MARRVSALAAVLTALALSSALAAPGKAAGQAMTLGDFSRSLVETLRASGAPVSDKVALVRGVVSGREQAPLTEGVAVTLLGAVGLDASTTAPGREIGQARALALLRNVIGQVDTPQVFASSAAPTTQGNIEPCLMLANHGKCVECCKEQGIPASSCAKSCFVINKPSPSEPLP